MLAGTLVRRLTWNAPEGVTGAVVPGGVEVLYGDRVWQVPVLRDSAPTAIALNVLTAVQQASEAAVNGPWPGLDAKAEAFLDPPFLNARYANEEPLVSVQAIWTDGWPTEATD